MGEVYCNDKTEKRMIKLSSEGEVDRNDNTETRMLNLPNVELFTGTIKHKPT